jgi:predicted transcriptional regulator
MPTPYPEIAALADRIFRSGLKTRDVLTRAEISRSTWWRLTNGGDTNLSTVHQISRAIDALNAEKD